MADATQIKKACEIVLSDKERRLVVVSAPGKRFKDDIKVTDLLIILANKFIEKNSAEKELQDVVDRYSEIAKDLKINDEIVKTIETDLRGRLSKGVKNKGMFMDSLKASGEDNCAKLVAAYLLSIGVEAQYVNPKAAGLLLSDEFGNARVLPESYENLKALNDTSGIMIFPGFFGYTLDGEVATFPRGGSDITGSILAAAIDADVYENFTDVDSVFVANPNVVENPMAINELTYREMRELSYAGFSVLHEETLEPVYKKSIPVCIKNTNNPSSKGTMISTSRKSTTSPVAGIASDKGFCSINLSKYLMNREIGFTRRLLQILEDEGVSYEHMPSGIDNISVIMTDKEFNAKVETKIVERIKNELFAEDVSVERGLALVMIVGEGMMHSVGIAARATNALSNSGINIQMINQGSSEVSMMYGILSEDESKAVKALYSEFFH